MHHHALAAILLGSLVLTSCATKKPRPAERAALRVDVDGTMEFDAPVAAVQPAVGAALRSLGHTVAHDDAAAGLIETAAKPETVARWRWNEVTAPGTVNAATATASILTGALPIGERVEGSPPAGEITLLVSYVVTLVPTDETHTRMVLKPKATLDGDDMTDRYVADVLGPEEARRKWDEVFDAVRAALATSAPATASPAGN